MQDFSLNNIQRIFFSSRNRRLFHGHCPSGTVLRTSAGAISPVTRPWWCSISNGQALFGRHTGCASQPVTQPSELTNRKVHTERRLVAVTGAMFKGEGLFGASSSLAVLIFVWKVANGHCRTFVNTVCQIVNSICQMLYALQRGGYKQDGQ